MENEGDGGTICSWCTWNGPQNLGKTLENLEIKGRIETIQTTALLKLIRILRRVPKTWGDFLLFGLLWKTRNE